VDEVARGGWASGMGHFNVQMQGYENVIRTVKEEERVKAKIYYINA
jgi:hypothetical protein